MAERATLTNAWKNPRTKPQIENLRSFAPSVTFFERFSQRRNTMAANRPHANSSRARPCRKLLTKLRPFWPLLREPEFKTHRVGAISAMPVYSRSPELLYEPSELGSLGRTTGAVASPGQSVAGRALRYAGGSAPTRHPTQTTCH